LAQEEEGADQAAKLSKTHHRCGLIPHHSQVNKEVVDLLRVSFQKV